LILAKIPYITNEYRQVAGGREISFINDTAWHGIDFAGI
jgi:hypothetical protein